MQQFILGFLTGVFCCVVINVVILLLKKDEKENEEIMFLTEEEPEKQRKPEPETEPETAWQPRFFAPEAKLLLVDDSSLSRRIIRELLRDTRIQIEEAANGSDCLDKVKRNHFDLILLDHLMPGLDGMETFRRMMEHHYCEKTPVVAMSANIAENGTEYYLQKGLQGAVGKPIQGKKLEELFIRLLPKDKIIFIPEGFSYENGVKHFNGDEDAYLETLTMFADLWQERKETLQTLLSEEDMKNYAILIHGIKGDARTLGANILAKMAYEQEIAAKAGNIKSVLDSMERLLDTGKKTADYFYLIGKKCEQFD